MEAHNKFFKVSAKRILRIESAIEDILIEIASNATTLSQESLFNYFKSELIKVLQDPTKDIIAYKTIAAYRTGLKINIPTKNEITLRSELETVIKSIKYSNDPTSYRLVSKIIIDFGVFTTLQQAALNKKPVQFHVGFGDKDLDLIQANPLLIRNLLEYPEFSNVNFVLLHNYPVSKRKLFFIYVFLFPYSFIFFNDCFFSKKNSITEYFVFTFAYMPSYFFLVFSRSWLLSLGLCKCLCRFWTYCTPNLLSWTEKLFKGNYGINSY